MESVQTVSRRRDVAAVAPTSALARAGAAIGALFGLSTIAGTVSIVGSAAALHLGLPDASRPAVTYQFLNSALPVLLPTFLLVSLGATLTLIFVRALDLRLRHSAPVLSPIAATFGYLGFAVLSLDFVGFVYVLESIAAGSPRSAVEAALPSMFVVVGVASIAGSLIHGVWLFLVSWIMARRGALPAALGYFGLLAAVVAVIGVNAGLKGIPSLLPSLWLIATGIVMWRRPEPS